MALLDIQSMLEEGFERIGVDPRSGYHYRTGRRSLDILLSDWANRGLNLWTVVTRTYAVVAGTATVNITSTAFDVMDAVIRDESVTPNFDLTMSRISPTDYLSIPFKTQRGTPTRYLVRRTTPPMTLTLWQVPDRNLTLVTNELEMLPSVSGYTGSLSIPERFQNAMISGLAYQLAMKFAPDRIAMLKSIYDEDFERAAMEDRDRSSFMFQPDVRPI